MHANVASDAPASEPTRSVVYEVTAEKAPGVFVRIVEAFARRELQIHSLSYGHGDDSARVTAVVHDITELDARQVCGQLRQIVGVLWVESKEATAPAAFAERPRLCA